MSSRESRTEIAFSFIERAISEADVTSGDKFYYWLRENDLDVRRATARDVWRDYGEQTHYADAIARYDPNLPIPRAWITDSPSTSRDNYVIRVKANVYDRLKGETVEAYAYATSKRQPRIAEAIQTLRDNMLEYKPEQDWDDAEIEVKGVYHVEGKPW